MHIINECQIIISIWMLRIKLCAYFKVFDGQVIFFIFEESQSEVVLELCICGIELAALLECSTRLLIETHLVQRNPEIEEAFG